TLCRGTRPKPDGSRGPAQDRDRRCRGHRATGRVCPLPRAVLEVHVRTARAGRTDGGSMNRKFTSLAGGLAVAALVVGGSVAASAAGSTQTEKVGYFEVQDGTSPAGWFSEGDDGIEAISFSRDAVIFAADSKAVGINKIVDTPYTSGI